MSWQLANALVTLRNQINAAAPKRSKASDGSIGDAAHFSTGSASDHNPWCGPGIVTAIDITHDPANGCDVWVIAQALAASRDPRLKYLIYTGHAGATPGILSATVSPWTWRTRAADDHPHHLHVSVSSCEEHYGDTSPWRIAPPVRVVPTAPSRSEVRPPLKPVVKVIPKPVAALPAFPGITRQSTRVSGATRAFQIRLKARGWTIATDGVHGPKTTAILKAFQKEKHLTPDGVGGPATWRAVCSFPVTA